MLIRIARITLPMFEPSHTADEIIPTISMGFFALVFALTVVGGILYLYVSGFARLSFNDQEQQWLGLFDTKGSLRVSMCIYRIRPADGRCTKATIRYGSWSCGSIDSPGAPSTS